MRCQRCGAYIRDDSIYCNYCGEKVIVRVPKKDAGEQNTVRPRDEDFDAAPAAAREEGERTAAPQQKPWVIAVILLAGVVFAVFAVIFYQYQRKNQKTVINPVASVPETTSAVVTPTENPDLTPSTDSAAEETVEPETVNPESAETEDASEAPAEETQEETSPSEETLPEGAVAEVDTGGMTYRIEDGRATLIKCNSEEPEIVLPESVSGVPLKAIGEAAFANCFTLEGIDIPEGVEELGVYCFTYCTSLRTVVIPDSVTRIGDHAFDNTPRMIFVIHEGSLGYETAVRYNVTYVIGDSLDAALNAPLN